MFTVFGLDVWIAVTVVSIVLLCSGALVYQSTRTHSSPGWRQGAGCGSAGAAVALVVRALMQKGSVSIRLHEFQN